jgi:hypothetical protein
VNFNQNLTLFSELGEYIHLSPIRIHVSIHDDMGRGQLQVSHSRENRPEAGNRNELIPAES